MEFVVVLAVMAVVVVFIVGRNKKTEIKEPPADIPKTPNPDREKNRKTI